MTKSLALAALAVTLCAAPARDARAGYCGEEGARDTVKDLERYAKRAGKAPELDDICVEEALYDRKLKKRMMTACEAILAREPGFWDCIAWAADDGIKTHGGVDIYDALTKARPLDPFDGELTGTAGYYVRLGDPRALAPMRAAWTAAAADPRAKKKRHEFAWKKFRNNAIELFGRIGGAAEKDFLAAQVPATKDRGMAKRMKKAIAAIEQRTATNP